MRNAAADVLVHRTAPDVDVERAVPAVAKARDAVRVQGDLPRRQHAYRVDPVRRPLGVGVECAQGLDAVVEEIYAQRGARAHREDVDERTAHGVFAPLPHGTDVLVAGVVQAGAFLRDGEALAGAQGQGMGVDERRGSEPLHERADRGDEHAMSDVAQPVERGQAFGDDVLVGREPVVRQGLPIRERAHGQRAGSVEVDLVAYPLGGLGVARGVQHERPGLGREPRRAETRAAAEQCLPVVRDVADRRADRRLGGCHLAAVCGGGKGPRILSQRSRWATA